MHVRARRLVAAAIAASLSLTLFGSASALAEGRTPASPPEHPETPVEPELVVIGLRGAAVVGTVRCGEPFPGIVSAFVTQAADPLPVKGGGRIEFDCGPEPTPFAVPLEGDGVLHPGSASFQVFAEPRDGSYYELFPDLFVEELDVRRKTALIQTAPDLPGTRARIAKVAEKSPEGPVIRGAITCSGSTTVTVDGWQLAGRYLLPITGSAQVECDGKTHVAIPVTSDRGQLKPGPASITVSYTESGEERRTTQTVILRSATPEPDFTPEPDPESPVQIADVRRVGDSFEVDIVLSADCSGSSQPVVLAARVWPASLSVAGRWFNPRSLENGNAAFVPCTSTSPDGTTSATVTVVNADAGDEVVVKLESFYGTSSGGTTEATNAATFTVPREDAAAS